MNQALQQTQDQEMLSDIIQQALEIAKKNGASTAEMSIGTGNGLTVTTRLGEVEKVEHERDKALAITVFIGNKKGCANSTDFSADAIRKTVQSACDIAKFTNEDQCNGLAAAELMTTNTPDLDLYHPWQPSAEEAIQLAIDCESTAMAADKRINNSDGTSVSSYAGNHFYGNTHGFIDGWYWSSHSIDCNVIAGNGGNMQRDSWYSKACKKEELEDIHDIAREAAKRTVQRLDSRKLSTRRCPVIFEAPVASGLLGNFIGAISGGSLYRKASFLLDKLGQQVFAEHIHIYERPHLRRALGSVPFDGEGMATKDRDLIVDGVLKDYVLSSYSARKLGLQVNANSGGVHNLTIGSSKPALDLPGLIEQMQTGLLITDMIGVGVNQITGDYSRGAAGFWVENGEIQYPVEEITVADNLAEMYKKILHIGSDIDRRGNILTGSILIQDMTVAGD